MRFVGSRCFAPSDCQTQNTQMFFIVTDPILLNIILKIMERKRSITNKHL